MKKVTVNGTVTSHERYLYRGYLQLAALDMLNSRNVLRTLLWDPLEPMATRPLALVQDNALYCYGVDFNKGTGRFGKWLENLNDWNLSRSRYSLY